MEITVTEIVRDEGSVVIFGGVVEESRHQITFAVDHRYAQDIIDALVAADGEDDVTCIIEEYQIVGAA